MKIFADFFPILLFFIAYKSYDIYVATGVAIVATLAQVLFFWLKYRRIESMHLVTLALIVIFGGATLLLKDELFIKWKLTVINWLFGGAFLASQFVGQRTLIERLIKNNLTLPHGVWKKLNLSWALFFILVGCVNLIVMYSFDTETWVNFKLFGTLGLTLAFVLLQAFYLSRHLPESEIKE